MAASMAQSSVAPISVTIESSHRTRSVAEGVPSLPLEPAAPAVPVYARPPSPPSILATTGSAVKGLLVAARDGSDLFLPLKAALVSVVALWDLFDVSIPFKH